jgi:predicted methyltransferase
MAKTINVFPNDSIQQLTLRDAVVRREVLNRGSSLRSESIGADDPHVVWMLSSAHLATFGGSQVVGKDREPG